MKQTEFITIVKQIRSNQANYQTVVLRALIDKPINDIDNLCIELSKANNNKNPKFFKSCPVWKVLSKKQLINIIDGKYKKIILLNCEVSNEAEILREINKLS